MMPTHMALHEGYEPAPSASPGLPSLQQVWSVCFQSQRALFISQLKIKLQPAFCKEKTNHRKGGRSTSGMKGRPTRDRKEGFAAHTCLRSLSLPEGVHILFKVSVTAQPLPGDFYFIAKQF